MKGKIFGIGQPKTGTSSLGRACETLGFRHKTWDPVLLDRLYEGDFGALIGAARHYDSFDDLPWSHPYVFPLLDAFFPGSKFVLTTRDPDSWIDSIQSHFTTLRTPPEHRIFDFQNKAPLLRERYIERNKSIIDYFLNKGRKDDLLVIDVCSGEGWDKLCPFLQCDIPDVSFPRMNISAEKTSKAAESVGDKRGEDDPTTGHNPIELLPVQPRLLDLDNFQVKPDELALLVSVQ